MSTPERVGLSDPVGPPVASAKERTYRVFSRTYVTRGFAIRRDRSRDRGPTGPTVRHGPTRPKGPTTSTPPEDGAHADQTSLDVARARDALDRVDAALDVFFGDGGAFGGEPVEGIGEQFVEVVRNFHLEIPHHCRVVASEVADS